MATWSQNDIHKHMTVYSADNKELGHITNIYEDSFSVHKGFLFTSDRYIPYSEITNIENNKVYLQLSSDDLQSLKWEKRPDYEHHLGDPTQLFYDRGHGIHDPFDPDED